MKIFSLSLCTAMVIASACSTPQERQEQRQEKRQEQYNEVLKQSREQYEKENLEYDRINAQESLNDSELD